MTSETEAIKTNEFLRRRKLRLQQVREQSKDIAKKIRQRAKVEKLRRVVDLDGTKQKEYFECQEKLVKRLEVLYARGLDNVGASHQSASELTHNDEVTKSDLSKLRGKEATAELRRKKQEKLDQQKKLLDRKLQARETANEISRDKSSTVAQRLLSKSTGAKAPDDSHKVVSPPELATIKEADNDAENGNTEQEAVRKSDMATQWDADTMPNEWEPAVPALSLPVDKDTPREEDNPSSKTDKNKRLDLFALSKEMPSSLRGKYTHEPRERETSRPSLTLVSEYLQSRKLRLRETETPSNHKKTSDDINSLKQTILHTRTSRPEVAGKGVASFDKSKPTQDHTLNRKSSVMMYNHSTRDTRDMPCGDNSLVVRDPQSEEDAYSQAMKVSSIQIKNKQHQKKAQDMRNKVAVTKQNVEKEYKDTMNFLNSLPKDQGSKVIKTAYMDENRQQLQEENRQQKMQQEFKKIEKECKRHQSLNKNRSKSRSSAKDYMDDNFDSRDFQYSWMPVPESDSNLAIHAIPNTVKQGKSDNSVRFSTVDSYHEYRSRHKHTPPTKDTTNVKQSNKKVVETVIIDKDASESSDSSSISSSDTSSVRDLSLDKDIKCNNANEINKNLSDAERIIIYKVLDSRSEKKSKRQTKLLNEIAKSLTCIEQGQKTVSENNAEIVKKHHTKKKKTTAKSADNAVSFEQLNEGVYKMTEEQGASYNVMSCCTTNVELWHTAAPRKPWWDNIASMYFADRDKEPEAKPEEIHHKSCHCVQKGPQTDKSTMLHWESGDCIQSLRTPSKCAAKEKPKKSPPKEPSIAASTSSFITATNEKGTSDAGGYIKLVDESGQEAGKFFIGANGFLNDNAYEVVIQLRKKDGTKEEKVVNVKEVLKQNKISDNEISSKSNDKEQFTSSETDINDVQPPSDTDLHELLGYRSLVDKESDVMTPTVVQRDEPPTKVSEGVMTNKKAHNTSPANSESSDNLCLIQSTSETKDMRNKGVHTHFTRITKRDTPTRPATTTYTQTTLSSPVHRPVFFHMSSSTSTAYMSPPEMILPKCFRRDYGVTEDEMYDVLYDPIETIEMTEKKYCEEYTDCTCRKCMHARKVTLSKQNAPCRKNKYDNRKMKTPPNTARSPTARRHEPQGFHEKRVNAACKTKRLEKTKCKFNNLGNVDYTKRPCRKNKRPPFDNIHASRNINMHVGINLNSREKYSTSSHDKKLGRSNLNPIIQDYVNKLLALNREGIKAFEVADQECSSVGTPGSSIINVPYNVDETKSGLGTTISLEQIKNVLRRQILEKHLSNNKCNKNNRNVNTSSKNNLKHCLSRVSRKKPVHKIKSLNISRNLLRKNILDEVKTNKPVSPSSTDENFRTRQNIPNKKSRSKSSPTPRTGYTSDIYHRFNDCKSTGTEKTEEYNNRLFMTVISTSPPLPNNQSDTNCLRPASSDRPSRGTVTTSHDSVSTGESLRYNHNTDFPVSMSTQTNQNVDSDTKFMKLAEDKLHNMEKIADLTEKCTKRLSNLAKVLEEVRKNKSLVYSQISSTDSTDSQSDHKSDRAVFDPNSVPQRLEIKSPDPVSDKDQSIDNEQSQEEYTPVLTDIPKPAFKVPEPSATSLPKSNDKLDSPLQLNVNTAELIVKYRQRPPPALSRINLKHGQDYVIPHELSTVIEVDSPMSMKHKNQSSRNDAQEAVNNSNRSSPEEEEFLKVNKSNDGLEERESSVNPDLLESNANIPNKFRFSSTESSEDSKFQMIDLKQFNEIMLEPFISIHEYAKQYNLETPDEGSNIEQRDDIINDDMSSLHSDGSLPDVIAELLKRNIIAEPFKFDTASNINSTTISSESTLSMLALSKVRKDRKRSSTVYNNKENIGETSDTLSISSNPDLENAFKKLGMGWASSTLKKTKERLALSSSSNTSSSSIPQFKMKSFNHDIPALVTDSVSSVINSSKKRMPSQNAPECSKNAEQQTNLSNSMTVKEFLRNELAKKITFNNKSSINDTEEEFVSLFETKIPDEMKENSQMNRGDRSMDSAPSGNRARTSTPVQIFKSMTYHSSSSSNMSNGLFSNADDLSSVKMTSNSIKNHSTSDKDDLTIPNFSLRIKKGSDCSKSD